MQLNLTGHHIDITDSLRHYVDEKMDRIERHFDKVTNTHVILTVENLRHKAEATINMRGNNIFAESTEQNMYAAIDSLTDKLDRQVKKHKEKITDHHQRDVLPMTEIEE
ncbi:Ribosome hibernation promoting factor Hpf [hydrothermal vent metagenome]|uniref:Ribosome hibernation promoting factor Hpf n=1 Tax=hydrothermal vent metagenome TaxID=652676 RepID=A0A3B0WW31_9ZZZZ